MPLTRGLRSISAPTCALFLFMALLAGCTFEGDDAGECSDGADNDRNGLFDCDDPQCSASPDCGGGDDDGGDDDGGDDDGGDDDGGDDDGGDDDGGDDDGGDDDGGDDDGGDDDGGDDDGGDDDGGDDDGGDDDTGTGLPATPSIEFDITSGALTGHHVFDQGIYCETDMDGVGWQLQSWNNADWALLKLHYNSFPGPGDHADTDFAFMATIAPWATPLFDGGPDCFVDFVDAAPGLGGYFECAAVTFNGPASELMDVANGMFRCP